MKYRSIPLFALMLTGLLGLQSARAQIDTDTLLNLMEQKDQATSSASAKPQKSNKKKPKKKAKQANAQPSKENTSLPELQVPDASKLEAPKDVEPTLYEELAGEEDDTVVLPSINIDHSFSFKDDKAAKNKNGEMQNIMDAPWKYNIKLTGQYTFGGPKKNDWGIKMTIPYVYNNPGDLIKANENDFGVATWNKYAAQDSEWGLGDINFKLKRTFSITKKLRAAAGFYLGLPSAEEYTYTYKDHKGNDKTGTGSFGQNQYRFEQDLALSYKHNKTLTYTLTSTLKEGHKSGHDETVYGITVKPGVNIALPAKCLLSFNYTAKYSFTASPEKYQHDLKVKLNKRVGKLNVGVGYQNPLNIDSYYAHNVDITMSYNF